MTIKSMTLKQDATFSAPTGGTDLDFGTIAVPANVINTVAIGNNDNSVYREQEHIMFYSKPPGLSNGKFGKAVRKATVYVPRDYNEVYVKNLLKIEAQVHPSMSAADKALMFDAGIQLLMNARNFFTKGSME